MKRQIIRKAVKCDFDIKRKVLTPTMSCKVNVDQVKLDIGISMHLRRFRKATKQLATLGPVSSSFEVIEKLFLSGADVFRLNFSHGEHEEKKKLIERIRQIEQRYNHPISILADLQGPKLRVGSFEKQSVLLHEGQLFRFDLQDQLGNEERVTLPHPEILNTLQTGDLLLLDDGKLRMEVVSTTMMQPDHLINEKSVTCKVIIGGSLSN